MLVENDARGLVTNPCSCAACRMPCSARMEGERRTHRLMMGASMAGMQEGGSRGFGLLKKEACILNRSYEVRIQLARAQ